MALNGCSSGLLVTAVVSLLLLPTGYYVPQLYAGEEPPLAPPPPERAVAAGALAWLDGALVHLPPFDAFVTLTLLVLGISTYLFEWIQRKQMKRRLVKLNQFLGASVERLRAWDTQQEQLEVTLKMVQNATTEYNLLLYLLLRQHRCLAAHGPPP